MQNGLNISKKTWNYRIWRLHRETLVILAIILFGITPRYRQQKQNWIKRIILVKTLLHCKEEKNSMKWNQFTNGKNTVRVIRLDINMSSTREPAQLFRAIITCAYGPNWLFLKSKILMAKKYSERCSTSAVIREMQLKLQWCIPSHLIGWLSPKLQRLHAQCGCPESVFLLKIFISNFWEFHIMYFDNIHLKFVSLTLPRAIPTFLHCPNSCCLLIFIILQPPVPPPFSPP